MSVEVKIYVMYDLIIIYLIVFLQLFYLIKDFFDVLFVKYIYMCMKVFVCLDLCVNKKKVNIDRYLIKIL